MRADRGPRKRGIYTVDDLRANSTRDPVTHCWHWNGAAGHKGEPRIWTFDHDRGDKDALSGPRAVWNVAHGAGPGAWLPYRTCFVRDCVCPAHLKLARNRQEICKAAKARGKRWGASPEVCRASLLKARAAAGLGVTPPETVVRVRELLHLGRTGSSIAAELGLSVSAVSRIKVGKAYRWLPPGEGGHV